MFGGLRLKDMSTKLTGSVQPWVTGSDKKKSSKCLPSKIVHEE